MRQGIAALLIALAAGMTALLYVANAGALDVPPAPALERPIVDQTKTLSEQQITELSTLITDSRGRKSYQIGVLMVPSLRGDALEDYSIRVARQWGIGEKSKNNGVLLLIAKDDRVLRIEVGSGLEGELTDLESGRITDRVIAPHFKRGDFYDGMRAGIESIAAQVEGRADPNAARQDSSGVDIGSIIGLVFLPLFFVGSWLAAVLARSKSWWAGGIVGGGIGAVVAVIAGFVLWSLLAIGVLIAVGLLFDFLVSRNFKQHFKKGDQPAWWAGGGWGGGLGGGSSGGSFGGGGFSGGGSSGSW